MMMMNTPFLSNNNCSRPDLVFQYGSPMFFTVERSTYQQSNNKRKYSALAVETQNEDPVVSVTKRARCVPVRCKRTFSDLNNYKSYRNEEEEVAEEEPAVYSPSKRTRTTLLSKGRVFLYTPSVMERINQTPATDLGINHQTINNQQETAIESITRRMGHLSLVHSQEETAIESLTRRMGSLSLAQSREETEIESLIRHMEKLSLAQSQEEIEIETIIRGMENLSLAPSHDENIKLITSRLSKLSLTQSQE